MDTDPPLWNEFTKNQTEKNLSPCIASISVRRMASRRLPWQFFATSSALPVLTLSSDSEEAMLFMQMFI